MKVFLTLEASKPNGANYRLTMGCRLHPNLASMLAALMALF